MKCVQNNDHKYLPFYWVFQNITEFYIFMKFESFFFCAEKLEWKHKHAWTLHCEVPVPYPCTLTCWAPFKFQWGESNSKNTIFQKRFSIRIYKFYWYRYTYFAMQFFLYIITDRLNVKLSSDKTVFGSGPL
jgi:hypothetical protein